MTQTAQPRVILLKKAQVAEKMGLHPESVARLSRQGSFPQPIRLGQSVQHGVRWVEAEVDAWIAERMAEREASLPNDGGRPDNEPKGRTY